MERDELVDRERLSSLNRTSFKKHLRAIAKSIGLKQGPGEFDLFIASRDNLIHVGEFYCAAADEAARARLEPLASRSEEFFFLVSVIDRIFLRLFGYSGPYLNWRKFPHAELEDQL